ncbi:hypothetical protein [Cytobacillus firmus]|uniref:hypothetical protein n=1 Tax=Cytobacillus firmus TaxID=1399 RepID=UPI0018CDF3E9|nr:hypothetical protein [Cytobacillus firmus]MBG9655401.1 hypothetical protein [Cytobacillus firmus]MED1908537.1 hypothetical protein [Cytobacillus firmus]
MFIMINENNEVVSTHYNPSSLDESVLKSGYVTEKKFPVAEELPGKTAILNYDPVEDSFFFVYKDRELTQEEKIQQLEQDLGDILLESAMDKAKIAEMETAQGDMLMEIAMLKMGGAL